MKLNYGTVKELSNRLYIVNLNRHTLYGRTCGRQIGEGIEPNTLLHRDKGLTLINKSLYLKVSYVPFTCSLIH